MSMHCPITGVYLPRFLMSVVAGFIFIFAFEFVFHGMLLEDTYAQTPELWRAPADMDMGWMTGAQILLAVITAMIFTRNFEGKGLGEGLRYGLMIGLFMGIMMAGSYAWMPISMNLALAWLAGGIVMGLGLGVIYALTYKDPACKGKSCS